MVAFPLAAGVWYPFVLSPKVAALSMSGGALLVAINALMLKRTRLAFVSVDKYILVRRGLAGARSMPDQDGDC